VEVRKEIGRICSIKVQLNVLIICIFYSSLFLALLVSAAICTHPQEHKLQGTAIGVCKTFVTLLDSTIHCSAYHTCTSQTTIHLHCTYRVTILLTVFVLFSVIFISITKNQGQTTNAPQPQDIFIVLSRYSRRNSDTLQVHEE
jgi:heme/copper-type cytochrome/quinol oxidase subunit 3